jgi:hypothetical protein
MADETNPQPAETEPAPQEQHTFSKDYVEALRKEAAGYRTRAHNAEKAAKAAREAFGLKPEDDIGEISAMLAAREAKALEKANDRLISAEIRAISGYDTALLERLINKSGVKVGDDGTVTGVKEAAEEVAKTFPAVKKAASGGNWVPKNPPSGGVPEI